MRWAKARCAVPTIAALKSGWWARFALAHFTNLAASSHVTSSPSRPAKSPPRPPSPYSWDRGAAARPQTSRRATAGSAARAAPRSRCRLPRNSSRSHASNFFLCAAPILIAGWPGRLASSAEVRRKPQPFHLGWPRIPRELAEDRLHLGGQRGRRPRRTSAGTAPVRLIARGEIGRDQIVLAAEMIIQRALGEAGLFRHRIDADGADALAVKQLARRAR